MTMNDQNLAIIGQYQELRDGKGYYVSDKYDPKPICRSLSYIHNTYQDINLMYFLNNDLKDYIHIDGTIHVQPIEHRIL